MDQFHVLNVSTTQWPGVAKVRTPLTCPWSSSNVPEQMVKRSSLTLTYTLQMSLAPGNNAWNGGMFGQTARPSCEDCSSSSTMSSMGKVSKTVAKLSFEEISTEQNLAFRNGSPPSGMSASNLLSGTTVYGSELVGNWPSPMAFLPVPLHGCGFPPFTITSSSIPPCTHEASKHVTRTVHAISHA